MNNWFNVPTAQTPIFVLFLSAGVLFHGAFSLWVSLKNRSNRNRDLFHKQRNLWESKNDYFSKLNEKQITDNKRFSKTVKPFLSNKVQSLERIDLTEENYSLVENCGRVAKELNSFFSPVVKSLNIPSYEPSKHSLWWRRLEDVFRLRFQKTPWRRLQDVLIKTNMFALVLRLQKTSSRRLQDILVKTNIFVLAICL